MWWNHDNTMGHASGWRGERDLAALACLVLLTACSSLGPKSISRDQFDYGNALTESAEQQLLANMVRLRYVEAPKFLNVASVINQYALEGQVSAGLGFGSSFSFGWNSKWPPSLVTAVMRNGSPPRTTVGGAGRGGTPEPSPGRGGD